MMLYIYIIFLLLVVLFELFRKKSVFVDFFSLFNLFFIFNYLIVIILFLIEPENVWKWKFLTIEPQAPSSPLVLFALIMAYVSVLYGYHVGTVSDLGINRRIFFHYGERTQLLAATLFFFISTVAFLLYAYGGYGGIVNLILSGSDIRAGREEAAGIFGYFRYVASGLTLSMILFYSISKYSSLRKVGRRAKFLFLLSFSLALIGALGTAGRGNIGMVFLFAFFIWLNYDGAVFTKKKIGLIAFFCLFVFVLVKYGKSALWTLGSLRDGLSAYYEAFTEHYSWYIAPENSILESMVGFARNIDHKIVTIYTAMVSPELYQGPRLFWDWPRAVFEILPGVSQPDYVVSGTPSGLNRDFLSSAVPEAGYVPPGWIAMRLINGSVLWLALGSFFAGYIGGKLNRLLIDSWNASPMMPGIYIFAAFFWINYILGADPFMFVMPNIATMIFLMIMLFIFGVKKTKLQENSRLASSQDTTK